MHHCTALLFSPRLTWSKPTTRSLMSQLTTRKQQSLPHSGYILEFLRMPFGLRNAAQTFQRFIDQVLHGLHFCYAYIDDLFIASRSPEEHRQHLQLVLEHLSEHGILINPSKCVSGDKQLDFLGHHVNRQGIRPLEENVQVLREFLQPTTQRKLREFLGLVNFCHCLRPRTA